MVPSAQCPQAALTKFIDECQLLAGSATGGASDDLGATLRNLIVSVPRNLSIGERLVAEHVVDKMVARIAIGMDHKKPSALTVALIRWQSTRTLDNDWYHEIERFANTCLAVCRNRSTDSPVNATGIPKVEQVLELVGRRFSDHRLSLASAASECGGSVW